MRAAILSATFLLAAVAAGAADLPVTRVSPEESARSAALQSWKISLAPLVGSQALDASSSYGMRELNPVLASANGGFEKKGAAIKLGVTGAVVGIEYLVIRRFPRSARTIAKMNWTTGIVTTGFAIHNYAIR
jgi:hypothetical protein